MVGVRRTAWRAAVPTGGTGAGPEGRSASVPRDRDGDGDGGEADGPGPLAASVLLVAVLAGFSVDPGALLPRPAAVPMLLLQIVTCLPSTRSRRGAWSLGAQVLLAPWSGLPGFLAASVLLIVEHRVRWALFALVVASGAVWPGGDGGLYATVNGIGNALAQGLIVYALTRLSDLYAELHATRGALAAARVAAEREEAGRELDAVLGAALADLVRLAGQGRESARELAAAARAAARRVRERPSGGERPETPGRPEPPAEGAAPRMVWPIVLVTHVEYLIVGAVFLLDGGARGVVGALYGAALVLVVALQAYHSMPRPPGVRPPGAAVTLGTQLLVALGLLAVPDGPYPQPVAFAAASVLILLPGRAAWPAAAGLVTVTAATLLLRPDGPAAAEVAVASADIVVIALVFYGLALLTRLVRRVREARSALAGLAAARERRRIARDVHDLLGYGLSAVALKGDLAARDPVPERAGGHLADAAALAGKALAELRAIPGEETVLTPEAEWESAREVLAAAGMTPAVRGRVDQVVPEGTDEAGRTLVATVLREAVTNLLRHRGHGQRCEMEFGPGSLRVMNELPGGTDELPDAASRTGGNGLRNLRERATALGAELAAGPRGSAWVLTLRLPTAVPAPRRSE